LKEDMPFYQVLCIAAHNPEYVRDKNSLNPYLALSFHASQRQIKSLVRLAATHILNNGGVVRGIQYWGTETLPQRMRSHGANHEHGEYVRPLPLAPLMDTLSFESFPQLLDDAF
jgi:small subunit ribosomal protein S6